MNNPLPTITPYSRMVLHIAPGRLSRYRNQECTVQETYPEQGVTYARVVFGNGAEESAPLHYLKPVGPSPLLRRSPLTLKPDADNRTEQQRQQEGITWLRERGYVVLVVGQFLKRSKCEKCGEWGFPTGGYGNQRGVMDTLVSHPAHWGEAGKVRAILGVEWKRSATEPKRTPEQLELQSAGISVIVWSVPMLAKAIYEFERQWIPAGAHPEVESWLSRHGLLPEGEEN